MGSFQLLRDRNRSRPGRGNRFRHREFIRNRTFQRSRSDIGRGTWFPIEKELVRYSVVAHAHRSSRLGTGGRKLYLAWFCNQGSRARVSDSPTPSIYKRNSDRDGRSSAPL